MNRFELAEFPPEVLNVGMTMEKFGLNQDDAEVVVASFRESEVWMNDLYQVTIRRKPAHLHLSIKRLDRQPIHDWRHLQTIKNELLGPEFLAFEVYPPESKLVDTSNQYHLWAGLEQWQAPHGPFGFSERLVQTPDVAAKVGAVQRDFPQNVVTICHDQPRPEVYLVYAVRGEAKFLISVCQSEREFQECITQARAVLCP